MFSDVPNVRVVPWFLFTVANFACFQGTSFKHHVIVLITVSCVWCITEKLLSYQKISVNFTVILIFVAVVMELSEILVII